MTRTVPARDSGDCAAATMGREWAEVIGRQTGLAIRDVQRPLVEALVRSRMRARGVTTAAAYWELLAAEEGAGEEWGEILERLVSRETSFFRHQPSFEAVRTGILPELRRRPDIGANRLTLLSAGCSTGQEAYALAMLALDDEKMSGEVTVWGADLSRSAIDCARRGRYSDRALDPVPWRYRDRYFRAVPDVVPRQFEVADALRERVRFVVASLYPVCNLLLTYDLILCQNVLIYLTPAAAAGEQLLAALASRLNVGGFLLSGPGEAPTRAPAGLDVVTIGGVRAFRRASRRAHEARS